MIDRSVGQTRVAVAAFYGDKIMISPKLFFGFFAHIGIRLDRKNLVAAAEKLPGEYPRARADVGKYASLGYIQRVFKMIEKTCCIFGSCLGIDLTFPVKTVCVVHCIYTFVPLELSFSHCQIRILMLYYTTFAEIIQ